MCSVSERGPWLRHAQWRADGLCGDDGTRQEPYKLKFFLLLLPPKPGMLFPGPLPHFSPMLSAGSHFCPQPPLRPCSLVQVDSLSVTPGPLGVPELMVSQPGCAYAILLCTWNKDARPPPTSEGAPEGSR